MRVVLADSSDVAEGSVTCVVHDGHAFAVYRLGEKYYVTDNTCTHAKGSLADGFLDGEEIECPLHQGRFHIPSGIPTARPCNIPIRTYPVFIEEGKIWIQR